MANKDKKIKRFFPSLYKPNQNKNIKALLEAIAEEKERAQQELANAKEQFFVETAVDEFLDIIGSNYGIRRPRTNTSFKIDDVLYRKLIKLLSFTPKLVKPTMERILKAFFGDNPDVFVKEINTNEIVIQIPTTLINSRDNTRGSTHVKNYSGEILFIDNSNKKIVVSLDHEAFYDFEHTFNKTLNGWDKLAAGTSNIVQSTPKNCNYEYGISFDKINGNVRSGIFKNIPYSMNIESYKIMLVDLYISNKTNIDQVNLQLYSDTSSTNGVTHSVDATILQNGWNTILFDLSDGGIESGAGLDKENLQRVALSVDFDNATDTLSDIRFGNLQYMNDLNYFTENLFQDLTLKQNFKEYDIINSSILGLNTIGVNDIVGVEFEFSAATNLNALSVGSYTLTNEKWKGDYIFDPINSTYYIKPQSATSQTIINAGENKTFLEVIDNANIPDNNGFIVLNYGFENEEKAPYLGTQGGDKIILDPNYTFLKNHAVNDIINVAVEDIYDPLDSGLDWATYSVDTEEPVVVVQDILQTIKASGTIIRFIIKF